MIDLRTIGLAVMGIVLMGALSLAYLKGGQIASLKAQVQQAEMLADGYKAAKDALEETQRKLNVAAELNARKAKDDAEYIERLEGKINETPPNPDRCLDAAGAGRVLDIE